MKNDQFGYYPSPDPYMYMYMYSCMREEMVNTEAIVVTYHQWTLVISLQLYTTAL